MIPNIYKKIKLLQSNPIILKKISRGIERETLRINSEGNVSNINHPYEIGSALTNQWITTDFSESLLEFVTPVKDDVTYTLNFLQDIHKFVNDNIHSELFWPFSIPPFINSENTIQLANYGKSNIGKIKTLYRKGLKNRYGVVMNMISGIHYNFSLSNIFWKFWKKNYYKHTKSDIISKNYLSLIRNYYRFGWIFSYLFGASPAIEPFFIKNKNCMYKFKQHKGMLYLPWATSLRLSNLGYTNNSIQTLKLTFNSLNEYIHILEKGITTPSKKFKNISLYDQYGNLQQINTNILQTENELYTYIRPKQKVINEQLLYKALKKKGIRYIEIRALDINPFSHLGINKEQILLLDVFLIWCLLADSPKINYRELSFILKNWEIVSLKGRKPKQKIFISYTFQKKTIETIGKSLFNDFFLIAEILDAHYKNNNYQKMCEKFMLFFNNSELTYSKQLLNYFMDDNIKNVGIKISKTNKKLYQHIPYKILSNNIFQREVINSHYLQSKIENNDTVHFKQYHYQKYLLNH